ncbi:hypothetical protein [Mastigocladopsis repens]|uniref:hypothetical protein n=1 Tax=Mastigocladopsis repens TaxID=221287 RepID=UPI000475084A|nr:hypothetical protein [Mastigocladopsis repens]
MLQLLYYLIHLIQPLIIPICFFCAWALTILVAWSMWTAARDSVMTAQQMHQIPCSNCQYFTNDYRLKCTVRPSIANTEEAINCMDYQPTTNPMLY